MSQESPQGTVPLADTELDEAAEPTNSEPPLFEKSVGIQVCRGRRKLLEREGGGKMLGPRQNEGPGLSSLTLLL